MAVSHVFFASLWFACLLLPANAGCSSKPVLNDNTFTLSEAKASYAVNETYEIICIPGYISSDNTIITCQSSGSWSPASPECTAGEGTYPWWMLLVLVTVLIFVVACILPRMLQCLFGKGNKKKKKDVERNDNQVNNEEYSDDDDDDRPESPVPDFMSQNKHKMNNMQFMSKLHEDVDKKTLKRANKNATF